MQILKKYKHLIIVIVAVIAIAIVLFVTNLNNQASPNPGTLSGNGISRESEGGADGGPTTTTAEGEEVPNDNEGF